jgi:hypothetical protein
VYYDDSPYFGRIVEFVDEGVVRMKFLKLDSAATYEFSWPKNDDITDVAEEFILGGPLTLKGTGPFTISEHREMVKRHKERKKSYGKKQ